MFGNQSLRVTIAAIVIAVVAATVLFIWPNYQQATAARRDSAILKQKLARLNQQEQVLAELRERVAAGRLALEQDLRMVPSQPDLADLIRRLSLPIDSVSVIDQTFTAGSASEALGESEGVGGVRLGAVHQMPVTADLKANFESVFALLRSAESMHRLVRVSSVRLMCKREEKPGQPPASPHGLPILQASIGLEAIFEPAASKEGR